MKKPTVAILRTRPETVVDDYRTLMEMAGFEQHLNRRFPTLIKPELSWHVPFPAVNTPPWQLEGVARTLLNTGYRDLCVVESRSPEADTYQAEIRNHLVSVFNQYHLEVRYTFETADMRWVPYSPKRPLLVLDRLFPDGIRVPDFLIGKNMVHLPTLKTHLLCTVSGAMRAPFYTLLEQERRPDCYPELARVFVDLLALQREIHPGLFCVVDGTTAGNGPGPRTVTPVMKDMLLASSDPVAIDAVMARIMGFDPLQIEYLRLAHDLGLGVARLEEIELVGEDISELNFNFSLGSGTLDHVERALRTESVQRLMPLIGQPPLRHVWGINSRLYHDVLWYEARGRLPHRSWLEQRWGQLFKRYTGELPSASYPA